MSTMRADGEPLVERLDWRELLTKLGPVFGLLFVYALFTALVNVIPGALRFATAGNAELMMRQTAVVGMACLGMTLIIVSGGIDLSVGANIALTTVVIALALKHGYSATTAAVLGVASASICGTIIGGLVVGSKIYPFIITLVMWLTLRGAAEKLADHRVVYPPTSWRGSWLGGLLKTLRSDERWMLVPPGVWATIVLGVIVALVLRYTRFGRHVFAVGSNEQTARLCGVAVERTKLLTYLLGGTFAGLAGVLEFSYISAGDPTTRAGAELDIIAAVVIGGASLAGGQGSIFGSLIGALIMTIVGNGCTKLNLGNSTQKIVTGGVILCAVALDRLRQRRGT